MFSEQLYLENQLMAVSEFYIFCLKAYKSKDISPLQIVSADGRR